MIGMRSLIKFKRDAPRLSQGGVTLGVDHLPISGTSWKNEGMAATAPNPGQGETFKISNPDSHGRIPQRISSSVRGLAEIVSANGKVVTLRSLSGSEITTLSVIMEY